MGCIEKDHFIVPGEHLAVAVSRTDKFHKVEKCEVAMHRSQRCVGGRSIPILHRRRVSFQARSEPMLHDQVGSAATLGLPTHNHYLVDATMMQLGNGLLHMGDSILVP